MKKIIMALILSINSAIANTDLAAAAATNVALTGSAIYLMNAFHYENWLKSELGDWKYDGTDATASFGQACSVLLEARVLGNRRSNSIHFTLRNDSDRDLIIKPYQIEAEFNTGDLRRLRLHVQAQDLKVEKNWIASGLFPLENKSLFEKVDWIDIKVPIYNGDSQNCVVTARLKRNQSKPRLESSYRRNLSFDLAFKYGFNVQVSGESEEFYLSQGNFGMDVDFYFWRNHGIHIGLNRGNLETKEQSIFNDEFNAEEDIELSESYTMLGYAGNYQLNSKYNLFWNLGMGVYSLENVNQTDQRKLTDGEVTPYGTLELDYAFAREEVGYWTGDWFIGGALFYRKVPDFEIADIKFGGDIVSLLFTFRMAL